MSSCAHFLFLPTKDVHVNEGTLVAFHHTAVASTLLRARPDAPDQDRFVGMAQAAVKRQLEFFATRKLSGYWLTEPVFRMQPTCLVKELDWSNPKYPEVKYKAAYDYWVPSRSMIESKGRGKFSGYWPASSEEAKKLLENLRKEMPIGKVLWHGPDSFTTTPTGIDKIPFC
jgi:hypothetical protein